MIGWGDAIAAKAIIYGKYLNPLTSAGFLKGVSRISMERAWWRCYHLWCCWWDREYFSPASESLPKLILQDLPECQEWGMAKGMPWGHSWTSHHLRTNRFPPVPGCNVFYVRDTYLTSFLPISNRECAAEKHHVCCNSVHHYLCSRWIFFQSRLAWRGLHQDPLWRKEGNGS